MKFLVIVPFVLFAGLSCSNPGKVEEADRKNLFQAEFFYERGFTARALMHAERIKKSSPRYAEAQEWVRRIEGDRTAAEFGE
ncbi:hypothetical protein N9A70_04600 [Akkermansiaceae bacterium]|nr:hypothetical protein [Akkermansiaceae bacterium]MDA7891805.1 hypothetical protein [Akkermansiaceae bacterium]MDB4383113.1 hypothetical protein [Akkermansiaceae bacterium]MDB4393479.1 hypothetical protein [bacterium]MDB4465738.1 hypothetical protein [Akkermansiaceae bacterium]